MVVWKRKPEMASNSQAINIQENSEGKEHRQLFVLHSKNNIEQNCILGNPTKFKFVLWNLPNKSSRRPWVAVFRSGQPIFRLPSSHLLSPACP